MYRLIVFLAFLAIANSLSYSQQGRTRARTAIDHEELCQPLYEKYRYKQRDYKKYRKNNGDWKPLDQVDDYDELSNESLRELALKKALAAAVKRRYLRRMSSDQDAIDIINDDQANGRSTKYGINLKEHRESSRRSGKNRLGGDDVRILRIDDVPETEHATGLGSRYPLNIMYPSTTLETESELKAKNLDKRKLKRIMKTYLSSDEDDEETRNIGDNLDETRFIDYLNNFDTRYKNKNANMNINQINEIKELPKVTIYPKVIPPSRSKYETSSFVEPKIDDLRDSNDKDNDIADVAVIENEELLNNENTREVFLQGIENGKAIDTDLIDSSDSKKNSTSQEVDDASQTEIITTVTPEISNNADDNEKKLKKVRKVKYRERLRRKKNKKPVLKRNQQKHEINVEQQQDDLPMLKTYESTTMSHSIMEDKINDDESKVEEVIRKENEPKILDIDTISDTTNSEYSGEVKNVGEMNNKLKVKASKDSLEDVLLKDQNESLLTVVEPILKANVNGSLERINERAGDKEVAKPSHINEDLRVNKADSEYKTNDQEEELKLKKMPKGLTMLRPIDKDLEQNINENINTNMNENRRSNPNFHRVKAGKNDFKYSQAEDFGLTKDFKNIEEDFLQLDENEESKYRKRNRDRNSNFNVNKNQNVNQMNPELRYLKDKIDWEPEILQSRSKPDRIARTRNDNVNNNKNVNGIDDIPSQINDSLELEAYRRSNRNKNFNQNVNKNNIHDSGVAQFVHKNEDDADDDERFHEIMTNRRNLNKNKNYNVNDNNFRDSIEENDDRVYEKMSNRRTLERMILDDIESNKKKNINRNVNKNVNINRNVNRQSNTQIPRRVERRDDIALSDKAVESILQEVSQLRKQLAEKEAESNATSNLDNRRALLQKAHNDMVFF